MPSVDDEIDRLYQLPLADFVPARTALAKQAGARAAEIKALQKPHAAAWAVNQLYWRRRKTYDRLITAADRARKALTQSLSGRASATVSADEGHEQALNLAAAESRDLLAKAGASTAPGTLRLLRDTLLALPGDERPGRLVRPLAPLGFGSLTSVLQQAAHTPRQPATVLKFGGAAAGKPRKSASDASAARRAEEKRKAGDRKRELATLDADVKVARTAAHRADAALAAARRAHAKAERRLKDAQAKVDAAVAAFDEHAAELRRLEREARDAETACSQLEFRRSAIEAAE